MARVEQRRRKATVSKDHKSRRRMRIGVRFNFLKTCMHAMVVAVDCAGQGTASSTTSEIAQRTGIPQQYVLKLVCLLCRARLCESTIGLAGGVRLVCAASDITIGDVVRAVSSTSILLDYDSEKQIYGQALDAFYAVLDEHRIVDIGEPLALLGGNALPTQPRRPGKLRPKASELRTRKI